MTTIAAIVNEKGGVSKSSSTLSLGSAMAARGLRVLLVDLDPQHASLTLAAGVASSKKGVAAAMQDYLTNDEAGPLAPYVAALGPTLDLLPSGKELSNAETALQNTEGREHILGEVLTPADGVYDVVLIDCPPTLGVLVTNALTAAQTVIIPVVPEYMAAAGLQGLLDTLRRIKRRKLNPTLTVSGIILAMVDNRTAHGREVAEAVRAAFGAEVPVLGEVKRSIRMSEAAQAGQSIIDYDPKHPVALAYQEIADDLLRRWGIAAPAQSVEVANA